MHTTKPVAFSSLASLAALTALVGCSAGDANVPSSERGDPAVTAHAAAAVGDERAADHAHTGDAERLVDGVMSGGRVATAPEGVTSVAWTREVQEQRDRALQTSAQRTPNMTYHGGKVMPTAAIRPIFWGSSWSNPTFAGDKITGLDSWYSGISGSNYAKTAGEYSGTNGFVGATTTYVGRIVDTSTASGGDTAAPILAKVCSLVSQGIIVPDAAGNGYYPVYTDVKRGSAGFCAWHATGVCGNHTVRYAFFWNLDGDLPCDPADTTTGHSQGLAALANMTARELSEARTDPAFPSGWHDGTGAENGDKCAWAFNAPSVTFQNASKWRLQGEWSNAAFNAGTGYPNSLGQKGCVDGH